MFLEIETVLNDLGRAVGVNVITNQLAGNFGNTKKTFIPVDGCCQLSQKENGVIEENSVLLRYNDGRNDDIRSMYVKSFDGEAVADADDLYLKMMSIFQKAD